MKIAIVGRGKVGRSLGRAARGAKISVSEHGARAALSSLSADLVVIAVRDEAIASVAERLAGKVRGAVVHCAGALGPEILAPLRGPATSLGVMHPAISMVDGRGQLAGAVVLSGDGAAVEQGRRLAEVLRLHPVIVQAIDRPLYHAAMALAANGAAALAAAAIALSEKAGLDVESAHRIVGPLLVSVGQNVERLGAAGALSGPVRRGSAATIALHLERIRQRAPATAAIYRAVVAAQLPIARQLGEASDEALDAIEALLEAEKA